MANCDGQQSVVASSPQVSDRLILYQLGVFQVSILRPGTTKLKAQIHTVRDLVPGWPISIPSVWLG